MPFRLWATGYSRSMKKEGEMKEMEVPYETVFGPNFKVRCYDCMEQSGWMALRDANQWWEEHRHWTRHYSCAKFIKKVPGLRIL